MRAATQSAISGTPNRFCPGWNDRPYPGSDGATTVKASRASPPKRTGSVRRGMISRNSNTEPGQPGDNGAIGPRLTGRLIRETCTGQTIAKVGDIGIRDMERERGGLDGHDHAR